MLQSEVISTFHDFDFQRVRMPIITVYKNPTDFVGKYVARLFTLETPTPYCIVKGSLSEIYEDIPARFVRLERHPKDDPKIVCTFI